MNVAKLLLVEDDNNLREIYEARLSAEGYEISTAQNGEEALSIAKQLRPDLIISDVMMPRISGFEMLDILRNTDELKNTKVIMLTALGQAEDRSRADNLGADKYLVKSQVTLEDIVQAAHELLEGTEEVVEQVPVPVPVASVPTPVAVAEPKPLAAPTAVAAPEIVAAPVDIVAPAPVAIAPEPVAQVSTTPVPVAEPMPMPMPMPEPLQPAIQPMVAAPAPEPITAVPVAAPALDVTSDVSPNDTGAVAIPPVSSDDFVLPQPAPPVVTAQEPTATPSTASLTPAPALNQQVTPEEAANDAVLEAAINNLTTEPISEGSTTAAPAPVTPAPTSDPINPSEPTGRKVISPITDPTQGPDINALLAQEEAEEANQAGATAPSTNIIAPDQASAPVPGSVPTPLNGVDPNSIAL